MSGFVNAEEQDILENWFSGVARPLSATHIGLITTLPLDDGITNLVEVSGGAYARQALTRNVTNWGSSTAGAPSSIESLVEVAFPQAAAAWGTLVGWGYWSSLTTGTLLFFAPLSTTRSIGTGDTARFAVGGLRAEFGNPGDVYT